jgi:hypothetical protein
MSLFVRKINKAQWLQTEIVQGEDVSADAITNCMNTKGNTLSVWEVESATDIDKAVLAIVAAGGHIETIDVVPMNREYLEDKQVVFKHKDVLNPVEGMIKNHINLEHLSYKKLGIIAYHIVDKIKDRENKRYTEGQLKEIFRKAVNERKLNIDDLSDHIKKKLYAHRIDTPKLWMTLKKLNLRRIWSDLLVFLKIRP